MNLVGRQRREAVASALFWAAEECGLEPEEVNSRRKIQEVVEARWVWFAGLYRFGMSFVEISRHTGYDRGTVAHGIDRIGDSAHLSGLADKVRAKLEADRG